MLFIKNTQFFYLLGTSNVVLSSWSIERRRYERNLFRMRAKQQGDVRHGMLCERSKVFFARIRSMTGRYCFYRCLSVNISGGGYRVSDFRGGYRVSDFQGGYLVSDFRGGGYPVLVKGKIFDSRFGLIHVQTGEKNFC